MTSNSSETLLDSLDRADRRLHLVLEARPQRAAGDRQGDRDGHVAPLDGDSTNHPELRHRSPELGVDHLLQRALDRILGKGHAVR